MGSIDSLLTPQFDDPQALPYGGESGVVRGKKGTYKHSDVLAFMRSRRAAQAVHSDGFLSLSGTVTPAYECECGFRGMFESETCARCGKPVLS